MADLKTNYKDDVLDTSKNEKRKFRMIQNDDGTVSFDDATEYTQQGDAFGAADINATNAKINEQSQSLTNIPIFRCGRIRVSYDSPQYLKANVVFNKEMPSYDYSVAIGIDSNVLDCTAIYYENRSVHGFGISIYKADANFTSVDGVNLSWIVAM